MAKIVCMALTSLDGYYNDASGDFQWNAPNEEVMAFINELERPIGTYLFGRRLYETMVYWETAPPDGQSPAEREFTDLWHGADKVVYSTTLATARSAHTRVERVFDPAAVRALRDASDRDLTIGGPTLAAHAFRAGLVDELAVFVNPVVVGGGTRLLPDGVRFDLRLLDARTFSSGVTYQRYRVLG
jgi:dihydrofolate reductase